MIYGQYTKWHIIISFVINKIVLMNWLPTGFICLLFVIQNFFSSQQDIEQTRFLEKGPRRALKQELAKESPFTQNWGAEKIYSLEK